MGRWGGYFHLAHQLGMHLHELLGWPGPMTHRQYLAWLAWLGAQWNLPDRNDHYLMQVALEVVRSRPTKQPVTLKLDDMKIPFRQQRHESAPATREQAAAWAKEVWIARVGGEVRRDGPGPGG